MQVQARAERPNSVWVHERNRSPIASFLPVDLVGAGVSTVAVIVINGFIVRSTGVWLVVPPLVGLVVGLAWARSLLARDRLGPALVMITATHWVLALTVAAVLPFMWPVMMVAVLMPALLTLPYVERWGVPVLTVATVFFCLLTAAVGLLNENGGADVDFGQLTKSAVVIGGLIAVAIPCGLIAEWTGRVQREELDQINGLNAELLVAQDRLTASRRRVVEAGDVERRKIERDLHDGAQQRLVALGVGLRLLQLQTEDAPDTADSIAKLLVEAEAAVEELRDLSRGIFPPILQTNGLPAALRAAARRAVNDVEVTIGESAGPDQARPDSVVETALYFVAVEALTNAAKHAPESEVEVALERDEEGLHLAISDNGPGFDPELVPITGGLLNMEDRVSAIGGTFATAAEPGRGTEIRASVPLPLSR